MYIDQDSNGNITLSELTPDQATAVQIALLAISENQTKATPESRFLRELAMKIDNLLPRKDNEEPTTT